eukprot:gene12533-12666_t
MHDGQNCISPSTSFSGVDWGLDEVMQELLLEHEQKHQGLKLQPIEQNTKGSSSSGSTGSAAAPDGQPTSCLAKGQIGFKEFISVLVWNTPQRLQEYMPAVEPQYYNPTSDAYLEMLVKEVKTFVDQQYRTLTGCEDTAIAGSSMGGLISLYALQRYPKLSPITCRLYFDRGDEGLDSLYGPYQRQVDALCKSAGYKEGVNYMSLVFPGEAHNEAAWRRRLKIPLEFLFGCSSQDNSIQ